jgi:hypothetical protein
MRLIFSGKTGSFEMMCHKLLQRDFSTVELMHDLRNQRTLVIKNNQVGKSFEIFSNTTAYLKRTEVNGFTGEKEADGRRLKNDFFVRNKLMYWRI